MKRNFKLREKVYCYGDLPKELRGYATIKSPKENTKREIVVTLRFNNEDITINSNDVYIPTKKICKECNNYVMVEHNDDLGYPYFCVECDENKLDVEVMN